ncbi:MAG: nucleic acid-binding protein [Candidatus Thermoplasmatota archaeon]|nr:nucleic acid-binding protein [Candidatus Thermoplasmatota archaeon]
MKGYVLDSSALFYGKDFPPSFECVITPGVVRELKKEDMGERLELLLATKIRVVSPSMRSVKKVEEKAKETGDLRRLSQTDIEIVALALDLGYELVSDDYSVQNIARVVGVPCRGMEQKGIREVYRWKAKCKGCGKTFDADVRECDVCGSETRTRRDGRP